MASAMTHSPARVLAKLLVDLGVGGDPEASPLPAWPVGWGQERSDPDNVITCRGASADLQSRDQFGTQQQREGVTVRVRAGTEAAGQAKTNAVQVALDGVDSRTVTVGASTYRVWSVHRTSGGLHIGKDKPGSHRDVFTLNVLLTVTQLS